MIARLFILLLVLAFPAYAAETPPRTAAPTTGTAILVVDVKRVLNESKASVTVQKKVEAQRSAFQTEIAEKEKTIRADEQVLLQLRGKAQDSEYADKENQLRQKFRDVEKYVQDRRQLLEQATTTAMDKVHTALLSIVTDIAHKRGAQTVLVKQQVLWSETSLDITDQVLDRLNRELPDVTVDLPPSANAAPAPAKGAKTP